jgi:hypothetical protein
MAYSVENDPLLLSIYLVHRSPITYPQPIHPFPLSGQRLVRYLLNVLAQPLNFVQYALSDVIVQFIQILGDIRMER